MKGRDPLVVMFHMALVAALVLSVAVPAITGLTAPATTAGWLCAAAAVLLQGCSIPLYFAAIPRIGTETSALINKIGRAHVRTPVPNATLVWRTLLAQKK